MKGPFQPVAYPKPYDGSLITVAQLEQLMLGIIIMGAKAGGKKKKNNKKNTHTLTLPQECYVVHLIESCRNTG